MNPETEKLFEEIYTRIVAIDRKLIDLKSVYPECYKDGYKFYPNGMENTLLKLLNEKTKTLYMQDDCWNPLNLKNLNEVIQFVRVDLEVEKQKLKQQIIELESSLNSVNNLDMEGIGWTKNFDSLKFLCNHLIESGKLAKDCGDDFLSKFYLINDSTNHLPQRRNHFKIIWYGTLISFVRLFAELENNKFIDEYFFSKKKGYKVLADNFLVDKCTELNNHRLLVVRDKFDLDKRESFSYNIIEKIKLLN